MAKKKEENQERFQLTELFMAMAGKDRNFHGTMKRDKDENGNPLIRGKLLVNEGSILITGNSCKAMWRAADDMAKLKLDLALHRRECVKSQVFKKDFFHN